MDTDESQSLNFEMGRKTCGRTLYEEQRTFERVG